MGFEKAGGDARGVVIAAFAETMLQK